MASLSELDAEAAVWPRTTKAIAYWLVALRVAYCKWMVARALLDEEGKSKLGPYPYPAGNGGFAKRPSGAGKPGSAYWITCASCMARRSGPCGNAGKSASITSFQNGASRRARPPSGFAPTTVPYRPDTQHGRPRLPVQADLLKAGRGEGLSNKRDSPRKHRERGETGIAEISRLIPALSYLREFALRLRVSAVAFLTAPFFCPNCSVFFLKGFSLA